jgi:hypothetical protein
VRSRRSGVWPTAHRATNLLRSRTIKHSTCTVANKPRVPNSCFDLLTNLSANQSISQPIAAVLRWLHCDAHFLEFVLVLNASPASYLSSSITTTTTPHANGQQQPASQRHPSRGAAAHEDRTVCTCVVRHVLGSVHQEPSIALVDIGSHLYHKLHQACHGVQRLHLASDVRCM